MDRPPTEVQGEPDTSPVLGGHRLAAPRPRLAWLDALRGVAALTVAVHHASYDYLPETRQAVLGWFDAGTYGVMVFFLVSGYIVPASLERTGSVRRFWISRLFRIYPLWSLACGATVALTVAGLYRSRGDGPALTAVIAHVTMLQDLLAVPNMLNVLWTLSYEMAFYLLVVALFMTGLHRRSTTLALVLAVTSVVLGGVLPTAALSKAGGGGPVVAVTTVLMAASIVIASRGRVASGVLGGVLAIVLVLVNGRTNPGQGLIILAVMFTGTAIYRAEKRQVDRHAVTVLAGLVLSAALVTGVWNMYHQNTPLQRAWCSAVVAAGATFGLGMASRHRRIPRWLTGLGAMSYSVYLLHPVLLAVFRVTFGDGPDRPAYGNALLLVVFVAVLLAVSWTTQRLIEAPMRRLGRTVAERAGSRGEVARTDDLPSAVLR